MSVIAASTPDSDKADGGSSAVMAEIMLDRNLQDGASQLPTRLATGQPSASIERKVTSASQYIGTTDQAFGMGIHECMESLASIIERSESQLQDMLADLEALTKTA